MQITPCCHLSRLLSSRSTLEPFLSLMLNYKYFYKHYYAKKKIILEKQAKKWNSLLPNKLLDPLLAVQIRVGYHARNGQASTGWFWSITNRFPACFALMCREKRLSSALAAAIIKRIFLSFPVQNMSPEQRDVRSTRATTLLPAATYAAIIWAQNVGCTTVPCAYMGKNWCVPTCTLGIRSEKTHCQNELRTRAKTHARFTQAKLLVFSATANVCEEVSMVSM